MTDDTQPEAMDLADWLEAVGGGGLSPNRCAALLREQHARIAELESELEAVGAGGVQALSAAPADIAQLRHLYTNLKSGGVRDTAQAERIADGLLAPIIERLGQAAPKAAQGVGNSGFDHKTAADFLNGKTVSDEAVRKFVAASRWAHDERAALSATLLAMHGVLTSREAEIALLKKALLEAEAAPQPAPAPLSDDDLVELGKSEKSGLHPWGIGTTRADYLRAVRAVLDAARKQGDTP